MSQNRQVFYKYDYAWRLACIFIYYNILKMRHRVIEIFWGSALTYFLHLKGKS